MKKIPDEACASICGLFCGACPAFPDECHMDKRLDMKKYAALARQAAAEGCVLLENKNHTLPIQKGSRVAVFGRSAFHYYKSGEGSGGLVNTRYEVGILDALKACEDVIIDQQLLGLYEDWIVKNPYQEGEGWGETPWSQKEMPVTDEMLQAAGRADISVIILGRTAGEDQDNRNERGSYLLTDLEEQLIASVCRASKRTAVILNVGNIIDMSWVEKYRPQAVLYVWQGGQEGGNGVLDVLTGAVDPCGKLTDTIAKALEDYPAAANFGDPRRNCYQEDIYVGYRYFETFARDRVAYPFGFGLSYSSFVVEAELARVEEDEVKLSLSVRNTGDCPGKEVVQLYVEAPQGILGKPARQLAAFRKTDLLQPGEEQEFALTVPKYRFASYDDSGLTGHRDCYILEAGEYRFFAGTDVRSAALAGSYFQEFAVLEQLRAACVPQEPFQRIRPQQDNSGTGYSICYEAVPTDAGPSVRPEERPRETPYTGDQGYRLVDVLDGKVSLEQFVGQLSDEDLICMLHGDGMFSTLVTPGTAAAFGGVTEHLRSLGIPAACCADGPSGIRMDCGMQAFSLPNGTALGCTFNEQLVEELFEQVGRELYADRVDTLLGPGMNIHRHPLNGRNFEYLSEDPLLTGKIAAAQLRGMHTCGVTGTIKHFAGNNQEYGRRSVDSVISQRALREIYLKGFEIAVKEGPARSVMTTYGGINGTWTAGSYDLCTRILRGEWGFDGIVMSDWWAEANYPGCGPTRSAKAPMAAAQNDLYMCEPDPLNSPESDMAQQLAAGYLTRGELQRSAGNILRFLLQSPALLRLAGRSGQEAERPLTLDSPVTLEGLYEAAPGGDAVVDGEKLHPVRGRMDSFRVAVTASGEYSATITARSNLGALAQLPVSVYCDGELRGMVLFRGSEGVSLERTLSLGQLEGGHHVVGLFYGASGLKIQSITIHREA